MKFAAVHPYVVAMTPFVIFVSVALFLGDWAWAAVDAALGIGVALYIRYTIRRIRREAAYANEDH